MKTLLFATMLLYFKLSIFCLEMDLNTVESLKISIKKNNESNLSQDEKDIANKKLLTKAIYEIEKVKSHYFDTYQFEKAKEAKKILEQIKNVSIKPEPIVLANDEISSDDTQLSSTADNLTKEKKFSEKIIGVWESKKKKVEDIAFLQFESDRVRLFDHGLQFFRAEYTKDKVWLFLNTTPFTWEIKFINNDQFEMDGKQGKEIFSRSKLGNHKLDLPILIVGNSVVSNLEKNKILKELTNRYKTDQEVRSNPSLASKMRETDVANTIYLKGIVSKFGWIDTERFGAQASLTAFLIVQHSGDASLMTATLPLIEKDVKEKRIDGQNYALLFDRLMLYMGKKQKYGTQVFKKENNMIVLPCENKDKVDEFRNELGLSSLSQYLKMFGQPANSKPVFFEDKIPVEK